MPFLRSILDSPRLWRWSFVLLIALPALALAFLAIRAVRAERLEQQEQMRTRQLQSAQLADARMREMLFDLESQLRAGAVHRAGMEWFTVDRSGHLEFPGDRLSFGPPTHADWPIEIETWIEQARAAELQGNADRAAQQYRKVAAAEPRLRSWAMHKGVDDIATDQITPGGLPLMLVTSARLEPRKYRDVIVRTRSYLRSGGWSLSFDERRFYDDLLTSALGDGRRDPILLQRAAAARVISRIPFRRERSTRYFDRSDAGPLLVVASPSAQNNALWNGVVIGTQGLQQLAAAALRGAAGEARVGDAAVAVNADVRFPLTAIPGWTLSFRRSEPGGFNQRTLVWTAFIALLIVTLLATIAGTMHIVRREADLARMQNDFIAGVSHDFKTPITAIRLVIERITSGRVSSMEQYRATAERELKRLERYVNRLLDAQQIQSGKRHYVFAPASLSDVVSDAVAEHCSHAEAKGLVVGWEGKSNGLPLIRIDRDAMTAAVGNLIGNAIKYSPAGTRIEVKARMDNGHATIEVADEGPGIDRDDQRRIFRRFQRGKNTLDVSGSGLGLALVRATVEAHHGAIDVESAPGKGSKFTITLPSNS